MSASFRTRFSVVVVAFALILATAAAASAASPAQKPAAMDPAAWGVPTRILAGNFISVSVAVDSTDHLHIAATESSKGLYYLTNRSGSWQSKRVLKQIPNPYPGSHKVWDQASITLDVQDRIHIAVALFGCNDCAPGNYEGVYYITDKGRARGTFPAHATKIAPNGMFEPTVRVSMGRLYVSYAKCACYPGAPLGPVWLATKTTGSWTRTKVTSHGEQPSLRIGSDGYARVAFRAASSLRYAVAHSVTGGFTLSTVPGTTSHDFAPSLALDSHNAPRIAWIRDPNTASGQGVRYITRTGSTWGSSREMAHGYAAAVGLSLDAGDRPHVVVGATGVRVARLASNVVVRDTLDSNANVLAAAIRAPASGHLVVVYACFGHDPVGIYVSRT